MSFKSQICTTEEQSNRLVALGLKSETADMSYRILYFDLDGILLESGHLLETGSPLDTDDYIPAWTLHRLIEMMPTYIDVIGDEWTLNILQGKLIAYTTDEKENFLFAQGAVSLYDSILAAIEWLIQAGHFNKEYLKE